MNPALFKEAEMQTLSPEIERPALHWLALEPLRAAIEFGTHSFSGHTSPEQVDGHPVIIFPGMATGANAVSPLRRYCERLGYAATDWGWGFNTGPQGNADRWMDELVVHVRDMLEPFEQTATLIGWSLGGIYAREVAKQLGPKVRQVITLGTPFNASEDHTRVGWIYRLVSGEAISYSADLAAKLSTPPTVPTTSIYSRSDGVVAWQTCMHDPKVGELNHVQDIEVNSSHIGLGWNPLALKIIADRLAQPPGQWRKYRQLEQVS